MITDIERKVLTKTDLVNEVAERVFGETRWRSKHICLKILNAVVDVITEALVYEHDVNWRGFVYVSQYVQPKRRCRNPKTNEVDVFPEKWSAKCRISPTIKEKLNP